MIIDTSNWVKVSGSFLADSAYQYMVIGNFFDDENTDTSIIGTAPWCYSYYFIDDVCLSTDSLGCLATATNYSKSKNEVKIFPNPFIDQSTITFTGWAGNDIQVKLKDEFGRLRELNHNFSVESKGLTLTINKGNLEKGMYFLLITDSKQRAVISLVIQ